MKRLLTLAFLLAMVITLCVIHTPNSQHTVQPREPIVASITGPTPPVAIKRFNVAIVDAAPDERVAIEDALGFFAARTPEVLELGYCTKIVVYATNKNSGDDDKHFDDVTIPNIAGHFEEKNRTICLLRYQLEMGIVFHELDHATTAYRQSTKEGKEKIGRFWSVVPSSYNWYEYVNQYFPYKHFVTFHSTRSDDEHRADWRRHIYVLLYELWRRGLGERVVYAYNPAKFIAPDDTWRAMLKWSLEVGDITPRDYDSLRERFQLPAPVPAK
jgi:hypothetical protein